MSQPSTLVEHSVEALDNCASRVSFPTAQHALNSIGSRDGRSFVEFGRAHAFPIREQKKSDARIRIRRSLEDAPHCVDDCYRSFSVGGCCCRSRGPFRNQPSGHGLLHEGLNRPGHNSKSYGEWWVSDWISLSFQSLARRRDRIRLRPQHAGISRVRRIVTSSSQCSPGYRRICREFAELCEIPVQPISSRRRGRAGF